MKLFYEVGRKWQGEGEMERDSEKGQAWLRWKPSIFLYS